MITQQHFEETHIPPVEPEEDFAPEMAVPLDEAPLEKPSKQSKPAMLPAQLDHLMISDITRLRSPQQLQTMFEDFERQVEGKLGPLVTLLRKVIMSNDVQQIRFHAANVDRWRTDVTRYFALASAFVEHGKSSFFLADQHSGFAKLTDGVRDAYRRSLTAGYAGFALRLEGLINDIDSRVNLVKKFDDGEVKAHRNQSGRTS